MALVGTREFHPQLVAALRLSFLLTANPQAHCAAMIEAMTVLSHPPLHFRKGNRGGKLVSVTFEGVLRVEEPAILTTMLENGIGLAKAFGCGLILVRRL